MGDFIPATVTGYSEWLKVLQTTGHCQHLVMLWVGPIEKIGSSVPTYRENTRPNRS